MRTRRLPVIPVFNILEPVLLAVPIIIPQTNMELLNHEQQAEISQASISEQHFTNYPVLRLFKQ
jgi:hypothetical protein